MPETKPAPCERHETAIITTLCAEGKAEVRRLLSCKVQGSTISAETCLRCPRLVEFTREPEGNVLRVHCRSGSDEREPAEEAAQLSLPRLTAADVMQRDVVCVRPDLSLDAAMTMFLESGLASAPVVDEAGTLVGLLRDSEVSLEAQAQRTEGTGAVRNAMCPYVLALPESTPLTRAAAVMALERQNEVVIVGLQGEIVGVLSAADVLAWLGAADGYVTCLGVRRAGFPRARR